jgi:hypothetical protein
MFGSTTQATLTNDSTLTNAIIFGGETELISTGKDLLLLTTSTVVPVDFPLSRGSKIFVNFSATKGAAYIYLDDPIS